MKLLKSHGILGINARNLLYIKPYNPKKAIKLADNKIKTKRFLEVRGIPVPKTINVISTREEAERFDFNSLPNAFVVKPNCGFGGEGIIPIVNKKDGYFITINGEKIDQKFLFEHVLDILDGRFSVSNISDSAFFEQLLVTHESLSPYTYEGLPDIMIIVYNLVPVMAMLRLPTKESHGKANLHQGAIGVGIDIATGKTTYISRKNKIIDEIPGIGKMQDFKIPFWDEILHIASKVQFATNLGYLAVDIALDKNSGPVLLEINARAGLGVQIANLAPLKRRLERVKGIKVTSPEKAVRIAKDMFGRVAEKQTKTTPGKQVIGNKENVELLVKKGDKKIIKALVNPTKERSIFDLKLAEELKLLDSEDYNDEQSTLKLKFTLKEKRIQTVVDLETIPEKNDYKMILGIRDIKDFLIDPSASKEGKEETIKTKPHEKILQKPVIRKKAKNHFEIDQEIANIDNKIKLLFHLRPINLMEEQKKFLENFSYNPQFIYPDLKFDPSELRQRLELINGNDSPLDQVFLAKKDELLRKIDLIENIDSEDFTEKSIKLFGRPEEKLITECERLLIESGKFAVSEVTNIDSARAKEMFEKIFKKYGLEHWEVKIKDEMVTDCTAGKNNRLFLKKDASFSEKRIKHLIVHEIETHILTAENGKNQPFLIFNRGLADYLITQEGLAMYNSITHLKTSIKDSYKSLALVIATETAMNGSFVETFEKILSYGIPIEHALRVALKTKRGLSDTSRPGAFTKDIIYYQGFKQVSEFVENGGRLKDLYIGKFNLQDMDLVKKIAGLVEPKYLPEWL